MTPKVPHPHGSDLLLFGELDCVSALRALGEDTRVRIVGLLLQAPLGVCEIARRLDTTYYNVSKHLRILREAGLLDVEIHGREHLYVVPERIRRGRGAHAKVLDLGCCTFQFDERG
jgi:DNA-binding transcriptional ArsR family regulator